MKRTLPIACRIWLVAVVLVAVAGGANAAYAPSGEAGAYAVAVEDGQWADAARGGRVVPYRAYLPKGLEDAAPVVIFSHGLGGTREHYEYLGRYWASHGYVSVHLQHVGSDDSVWRGVPVAERHNAIQRALMDPTTSINRPKDISLAIDRLEAMNGDVMHAWHGRLDLTRLGVAGHSFGAWTANMVGGQTQALPGGVKVRLADERVRAILAMSSTVAPDKSTWAASFGSIGVPAMHMTGTADHSPVKLTRVEDRRVPFDYARAVADGGPGTWLIVFRDAEHFVFSGRLPRRNSAVQNQRAQRLHGLIQQASLAFWDATLRGQDEARGYLDDGGLAEMVGRLGVVEGK